MESAQPNEQFKEIVTYLGMNRESRDEALNIILAFTAEHEQRVQWHGTEVDKNLLRVLADCAGDEQITTKAL